MEREELQYLNDYVGQFLKLLYLDVEGRLSFVSGYLIKMNKGSLIIRTRKYMQTISFDSIRSVKSPLRGDE